MRVILPLIQADLDGSAGWLAGLYYARHCARALAASGASARQQLVAARFAGGEPLLGSAAGSPLEEHVLPRAEPAAPPVDLDALLGVAEDDVLFPLSSMPAYSSGAVAVGWIPDFQHRHLPDFFSAQERLDRERQQTFIVARSERLVCNSEAVRRDLLAAFPRAAGRAEVVPFAVDAWVDVDERVPSTTVRELGLPAAFAYLPNQFWVHKNHAVVLRAWRELKRASLSIPLVCTGAAHDHRRPEHYASLQAMVDEFGLRDLVHFLGILPRAEQLALYRSAAFVLQPSLFEGWSTSVEEARSLGRRVLASDIPVLREQAPAGTLFFDPNDPVAVADRVREAWAAAHTWHVDEPSARQASRLRVREFGQALSAVLERAASVGRAAQADRAALAGLGLRWRAELGVAELDRAARLQVIEQQGAELGRLRGLEGQAQDLERRLAESESDRVARLSVIEQQGAELGRLGGVERQARDLERRLVECESDRAARLSVIEQQGAELGRLGGVERLARDLERRLVECEADRAARLSVIEQQGAELSAAHGQLASQHARARALASLLESCVPRPVLGFGPPGEIRRLRALLQEARAVLAQPDGQAGLPSQPNPEDNS